MKPTLLVLAAGIGSRYGSLKQLDRFGPSGETIIDYSIYDAISAGFGKIVFVIRRNIEEEFKEVFYGKFSGEIIIDYALQELDIVPEGITVPEGRVKPWGTGHAVMVAEEKIKEPFAVINADDFYGRQSFQVVHDHLTGFSADSLDACLVGFKLKNTVSEFGYVSRGICEVDERHILRGIVERTHIVKEGDRYYYEEEGKQYELTGEETVSMNLMGFSPVAFKYFREGFHRFIRENAGDLKKEYYLPSVLNKIVHTGAAEVQVIDTHEKWFGVTYKEDKPTARKALQKMVREGIYPEDLWGVKIQ